MPNEPPKVKITPKPFRAIKRDTICESLATHMITIVKIAAAVPLVLILLTSTGMQANTDHNSAIRLIHYNVVNTIMNGINYEPTNKKCPINP